jgi:hypothetical protein
MPNPIKKATYKEFSKVIVIFEPVELKQSPSVTNCHCHCDTGEVSYKFKCPNERRGKLIILDKLSVDRLTAALKRATSISRQQPLNLNSGHLIAEAINLTLKNG